MEEIPKELEHYFNDYRMILVDIKELDTTKIGDRETREMIQFVQSIYDVERKRPEQIKLTRDSALTAGMITKSQWLIEEARNSEEEVNVCEAMDRYVQKIADEARHEARIEGKLEGKRIGRELGKLEGKREGKQEEKRNVVILLLTKKLGKLSDQIIHLIETSSTELINQLIVQIFDIENEEDIIKFIH